MEIPGNNKFRKDLIYDLGSVLTGHSKMETGTNEHQTSLSSDEGMTSYIIY